MMGQVSPWRRQLSDFDARGYDKGRSLLGQAAWFAVLHLVFKKWWLPARCRPSLLRRFGATVGNGVLIRHDVVVQWPWKLTIGDDVWIGERAWIINLEQVVIEHDVCISQGAVLCTGSHVHADPRFGYDNGPITVRQGAWVALGAVVLRGVTVGTDALVPAGAVVRDDVAPGRGPRPRGDRR